MADSTKPEQTIRWDIDPAGNRLPGKTANSQPEQSDWAEQVHRSWRQHEFNLLGQGQAGQIAQGPVTKWQDNRIGYHQGSVWRYDKCGNRIEQISLHPQGYRRQKLSYDGAHQLTQVQVEGIDGQGNVTRISQSNYVYDALGRRLKKTVKDQNGKEHISYYGWDGDRLVHAERIQEDGARDIVDTIYEPGTFTPLLRLSTTAHGDPQSKLHLITQAAKAAVPSGQQDITTNTALQGLQGMMATMPEKDRKMMEQSMKRMLQGGQTELSKSIMRGMGIDPDALVANMRQGIEAERQREQTPVEIHFYHCDHLGTPIALTDRLGQIVWAAKHDPWGITQEEFNPYGIEQDIRLLGQHHDQETGLHYNYHRYYDPFIGSYVNQDPIGLRGGVNLTQYAVGSPLQQTDPLGLVWQLGKTFPRDSTDPDNPLNHQTIYCDDEQPKINTLSSGRCEESLKTVQEHEQIHLNDALKDNPNICKGNKGITQIVSTSAKERLESELRAHELNLRTLQNALKDPPPGCSVPGLEAQIRVIERSIEKVNAGTYPN